MKYKVVLDTFEGPLDLLLNLIDKAQVSIYDIPISKITDQYIDYIKKMQYLDLKVTSEFLVMASTLLEIKSKMLLPKDKKTCEDSNEDEESDPRLDLVKRLVEYKKYKIASKKLKKREKVQKKVFNKPKEDFGHVVEEEPALEDLELDLEQLLLALNNILKRRDKNYKPLEIDEIQRDEYTLDECIDRIKNELEGKEKIKFSKLFDINTTRTEIVVTFLSILELVKLKKIIVRQEKNFSDILIIKREC